MTVRTVMLIAAFLGMFSELAHADFKYAQSGQFTNGVAQVKSVLGTQAAQVTVYVQGTFLRIDLPDSTYGIIDLEGRREIQVDPKNRTYSIATFDEIRARDKATSEQFPSHFTQDLNLKLTSTGSGWPLRFDPAPMLRDFLRLVRLGHVAAPGSPHPGPNRPASSLGIAPGIVRPLSHLARTWVVDHTRGRKIERALFHHLISLAPRSSLPLS